LFSVITMPRSKSSRMNSQSAADPIEKVPFRVTTSITTGAVGSFAAPVITTFDVTPLIDARLSGIADFFQYYRFSKLVCKIHPPTVSTLNIGVGFNPNTSNNPPVSSTDVQALAKATFHGINKTSDSSISVGPNILLQGTPIKWYQSKVGTEDTEWEVQGQIFYAAFGTNSTYYVTIEGVCEFKGRSPAVMTPMKQPPRQLSQQISNLTLGEQIEVAGQRFKLVNA